MTREELMEFAELVRDNPDKKLESIVKGYMDYHSINSLPEDKAPALGNNEQIEKECHHPITFRREGNVCGYCGHKVQHTF